MNQQTSRLHGSNRTTTYPTSLPEVQAAAVAGQIPSIGSTVQRLFRIDWFGKKSGALSRGAEAELYKSGAHRSSWGAYVPDATRRDANVDARGAGRQCRAV